MDFAQDSRRPLVGWTGTPPTPVHVPAHCIHPLASCPAAVETKTCTLESHSCPSSLATMGLALQLRAIWELLSLPLLPEIVIQWVGVERGMGASGRVVLTCPCDAAHASGCRGYAERRSIVSPPLLNTCLRFYCSEKPGEGGPAYSGVNTILQKPGQGSQPARGKKY